MLWRVAICIFLLGMHQQTELLLTDYILRAGEN
jgi:hypothetical protein